MWKKAKPHIYIYIYAHKGDLKCHTCKESRQCFTHFDVHLNIRIEEKWGKKLIKKKSCLSTKNYIIVPFTVLLHSKKQQLKTQLLKTKMSKIQTCILLNIINHKKKKYLFESYSKKQQNSLSHDFLQSTKNSKYNLSKFWCAQLCHML